MKTIFILLVATVFVIFKISDFSIDSQENNRLDGTWQLVESDYGRGTTKAQIVMLKVLHEGRFEGYFLTPQRSSKTMNGNFEVLNDSIYTESLIGALNKPMIGKTYKISYSLDGNVMVTKGSVDTNDANGQPVKAHFVETWKRVDYQAPQ